MNLDQQHAPTRQRPRRGPAIAISMALVIATVGVCYLSLFLYPVDEGNRSLWFVYMTPIVLTAVALLATLAGRPLPRWISGSVLMGTVVFWLGMGVFITIVLSQIA